ncbi:MULTISPECIES: hypothetical protein [Aliiglaciecola]|nr:MULTISPECIES: hypothetical protein [Aliiglaciecola]MBU2878471.1 hypothetical protein [Aliiglaciecola lipolytica]MDO6709713.1 hypothetical protein [Aliiglaciecola sp. 2_MG-2023]MDO6750745.1 hypothetical protein [Aliiglaciecola sp. 1_MG-2023]
MKKYVLIVGLVAFNSVAHQGHIDDTALQACAEKAIATPCGYVSANLQLHKGSCQQFNQNLICVRNKPLETVTDEKLAKLRAEGEVAISTWLSKRHASHKGH